jgi:hypothetical protein
MNNLYILKTFISFLVIILFHTINPTQGHAATCGVNSDNEITNSSLSSGCTVTPDTVYFPVYKIGLCTVVPTYLNYETACNIFFDKTTAQEVTVSKSSNVDLSSGISLDNGTYVAAIILLGNTISLKHSETFAGNRNGTTYEEGSYTRSYGTDDAGTICITRTTSGDEDDLGSSGLESFLDCYDPDDAEGVPAAGKFTETSGAYSTGGSKCSINSSGVVTAPATLTVTATNGYTVKFCGMLNKSTLETYTSSVSNATRQLAIQSFETPVVTTSDTSSIDIGFKVTDMLSLEERTGGSFTYTNAFIEGVSLTFKVE